MLYNPKKLDNKTREALLLSVVLPRPIAVVTTLNAKNDPSGNTNIAPFSLFNLVSANPAIVYVSIEKTNPSKRTAVNIKKSKEFVINIPNYKIAEKINQTASPFPLNMEDKFQVAGLTKIKSSKIKTAGIKECSIRLECKLIKVISFSGYEMFLGEVVNIFCDNSILKDGKASFLKHKFISRLGSKELYLEIKNPFKIKRIENNTTKK